MSTGLHNETGALLADGDHIRQSIADILFTPIGSRIMRRDYGSWLPRLIDQPADPVRRLAALAAAADALRRWEPRILLQRLQFEPIEAREGHFNIRLDLARRDLPAPQPTPLTVSLSLAFGSAVR